MCDLEIFFLYVFDGVKYDYEDFFLEQDVDLGIYYGVCDGYVQNCEFGELFFFNRIRGVLQYVNLIFERII